MASTNAARSESRRWMLLYAIPVVTVLALAVVSWRWFVVRAELKAARNELGELLVADECRLYVIQVPTAGRHTWKWRLHVPEGGVVIKSGYANTAEVLIERDTNLLPQGQYSVETQLHADELRQVWLSTIASPGYHQMSHKVPPEMQFEKWVLGVKPAQVSDEETPIGLSTIAIAGSEGQEDWPVVKRFHYPLLEIINVPIEDGQLSGVESLKIWIEQTE